MAVDPNQTPSIRSLTGTLASQQAAGQSLSLPAPGDVQTSNLEFQAQQLFTSSLSNTGQMPNPQFAAEALATNATPDVVDAYGDPVVSPYLVAGAPGGTGASAPLNGPNGGSPNSYMYDVKQHAQYVQDNLHNNTQYAKLGDIPIANLGYFHSIMAGDQSTVKKWQGYLAGLGMIDPSHANNGYMDATTKQAIQGYFVQLFTPQALFAKDSGARLQASQFLQGIGFDPNSLQQQQYNNPSFTTDMTLGWLQTQGNQDPKQGLNNYADQFGQDALPKSLQDLANPGFVQTAEDTAWSLASAPFNLVGLVASPFTGGDNKVADILNSISPQHGESQRISDEMAKMGTSKADLQALAPALQQVQGDTGWLPFDFIDRQWNRLVLATAYQANDAFTNEGDKTMVGNPFDPLSPMGQKIAAHENNLGAGLFGDQWAKDHPQADQWSNFIADSVDPIYWAGGAFGRLEKLGAQVGTTGLRAAGVAVAKGAGKLAEATTKGRDGGLAGALKGAPTMSSSIRQVLTDGTKSALDEFLDPTGHVQRGFADALMKVKDSSTHDMRMMLQLYDGSSDASVASLDAVKNAQSADDVMEQLQEHFPHVLSGPSALYNMKHAMRATTPNVMDRMGAGAISKMRTLWGQTMTDGEIDLTKPFESAQKIQQMFYIAGADESTINTVLNKWYSASEGDRDAMMSQGGDVYKTLDEAILKRKGITTYKGHEGEGISAVVKEQDKIRSGSKLNVHAEVRSLLGKAPTISKVLYKPTKNAQGEIVEGSMVRQGSEATQALLDKHQEQLDAVHELWNQDVSGEVDRIRAADPNKTIQAAMDEYLATEQGRAMKADYEEQVNTLQKWSEKVAPTGATRPAPFLTSQERMTKNLPFDPYALLVHIHAGKLSASTYETVASKLNLDYFHNKWKSLSLAQPSTMGRVAIGDDLIRMMDFAQDGYTRTALKAMGAAAVKGSKAVGAKVKSNVQTSAAGRKLLSEQTVQAAIDKQKAYAQQQLSNPDFITQHKLMNMWDSSRFEDFHPTDEAYPEAFANSLRVHARAPELVEYMKGVLKKGGSKTDGIARAEKFYREDPRAQERLAQHQADPAQMAQKLADFAEMLYPKTAMKRWVVKGAVDGEQMQKMLKNHPEDFHPVSSPRNTLSARVGMKQGMRVGNPLNFVFHDLMEPFVNTARGHIGLTATNVIEDQLRGLVKDNPNWDEARIKNTAAVSARAWMQNNLYQGQRSLAGTALRHAFPFYGATANMTKFFLRQFEKHPGTAAEWQRLFAFSESQSGSQSDAFSVHDIPGASRVLKALGFAPGETLSINPARSLFFTSDGFAAFVPGIGPMASPLMGAIAKDPHWNAIFGSIPGIKEQLSFHSGQSDPLFSYLAKTASGIGLMSPLHAALTAPIIGESSTQIQQEEDQKFQQMAAANQAAGKPPPTADEVKSELGKEMLTGQAMSSLLPLPVSPKLSDQRHDDATKAKDAFGQATTDAGRDAAKAAFPDQKPLLDYLDNRTPINEQAVIAAKQAAMGAGTTAAQAQAALTPDELKLNKDDIAQGNPWVVDYSTSMYQTEGGLPREPGLAGFQRQLQNGDIAVMSLDAYSNRVQSQWQNQNGYLAYEKYVTGPKQAFLAATGVTTASAEYKQFNSQVLQPRLDELRTQYPDWYKAFVASTSTPTDLSGKAQKAAPLNTVMAWETMPFMQSHETDQTVMWRKAIVYRDQAANQLAELQKAGAPKAETDMVMQGLQANLGALAQANPAFASELGMYDFKHWTDVVDYESTLEKTYGYNPGAVSG